VEGEVEAGGIAGIGRLLNGQELFYGWAVQLRGFGANLERI
jgi:hypothetical protein